MSLTLRNEKGSPLTFDEMDGNLEQLDDKDGVVHKGYGLGSTDVKITPDPVVTLTNGSSTVTGTGFDQTGPTTIQDNFAFYVRANSTVYVVYLDNVTDPNTGVISEIYDKIADPEENTDLGATWIEATGQYTALRNYTQNDSNAAVEIGYRNHVGTGDNGAIALGSDNRLEGGTGTVVGQNNKNITSNIVVGSANDQENSAGSGNITVGGGNKNTALSFPLGASHIALGNGNTTNGNRAKSIGHSSNVSGNEALNIGYQNSINGGEGNALIACKNTQLGALVGSPASPQTYVIAIGINGEQIDDVTLANIVVIEDLLIRNLPVYADEAAAVVGGLSTGRLYRTATGEVRQKL